MKIGLDFDNTIVCYDRLFTEVAHAWGLVSPGQFEAKTGVRDFLRSRGKEERWIELQGEVYGPKILGASPFSDALENIEALSKKHTLFIVSHKSKFPHSGPKHDLHAAALRWMGKNNIFPWVSRENIYFELTREEKIQRIISCGCEAFVDDLPEVFNEPSWPSGVRRILFDPHGTEGAKFDFESAATWDGIGNILK